MKFEKKITERNRNEIFPFTQSKHFKKFPENFFCKKVSHGTVCTHVFTYISHIVYTILHLDFDIKYLGKQLFWSEQFISY